MTQTTVDPVQRRNRRTLLLLVAVFFLPLLLAGVLRFANLHPDATRQKGELLEPQGDLRALSLHQLDGSEYRWKDAPRTWRIVVAARDCEGALARDCTRLLGQVDTVWQLMGKDADRVHVLWLGAPPPGATRLATLHAVRADAALLDGLPRARDPRGIPVYLVDPYGFVVLRYAPGSDPGGLRTDLSRLLKVN